jgi:hypothetical protein
VAGCRNSGFGGFAIALKSGVSFEKSRAGAWLTALGHCWAVWAECNRASVWPAVGRWADFVAAGPFHS